MTRKPTEMELRLAKIGYECAVRNSAWQYRELLGGATLPQYLAVHAWENQSPRLHQDWVDVVRAFIGVLRNPTSEMVKAFETTAHHRLCNASLVVDGVRAMLDVASPPGSCVVGPPPEYQITMSIGEQPVPLRRPTKFVVPKLKPDPEQNKKG